MPVSLALIPVALTMRVVMGKEKLHIVERLKERSSATPYGDRRPTTGRLVDF